MGVFLCGNNAAGPRFQGVAAWWLGKTTWLPWSLW